MSRDYDKAEEFWFFSEFLKHERLLELHRKDGDIEAEEHETRAAERWARWYLLKEMENNRRYGKEKEENQ